MSPICLSLGSNAGINISAKANDGKAKKKIILCLKACDRLEDMT